MGDAARYRSIEEGVHTDLGGVRTYAGYLDLDRLLGAQHPDSGHHDELLFIVAHQVTELWLKLLCHELRAASGHLGADRAAPALKGLARVKHVLTQMFGQWAVLETLTPVDYAAFRGELGRASGFQSRQYRSAEFLLGNKLPAMLEVFAHDPADHAALRADLLRPSLYDEFLRYLARAGHDLPAAVTERDWTRPYEPSPAVTDVFGRIYADPGTYWEAYEAAEVLVDVEEAFQLWRFRHLKTVERIIGSKPGTGGSSGVPFLRRALDLTFFPELHEVRTRIGT